MTEAWTCQELRELFGSRLEGLLVLSLAEGVKGHREDASSGAPRAARGGVLAWEGFHVLRPAAFSGQIIESAFIW